MDKALIMGGALVACVMAWHLFEYFIDRNK